MHLQDQKNLVALFVAITAFTPQSSSASVLIDDFLTGPYDHDTSAFKFYDNGFTRSRFYFQDGPGIIGTHRMIVSVNTSNNAQMDQWIATDASGGYCNTVCQTHPAPIWELDYGVRELVGSAFPWQFADIHANLAGNSQIRFMFDHSVGNLGVMVSLNTGTSTYHQSPRYFLPDSLTPFAFDVPTTTWTTAELSDVKQIVLSFTMNPGGTCSLRSVEATSSRKVSGRLRLQHRDAFAAPVSGVLFEFRQLGQTNNVWVQTASIGADGAFVINAPPVNGSYELSVKYSKWLRRTTPISTSLGDVSDLFINLKAGDADQDNEIGPGDFGLLSMGFGNEVGDPGYIEAADFNDDGAIDPADFGILSSNFGMTGDE